MSLKITGMLALKDCYKEPHPVEVEVADKSRKIVADTPMKRNCIQDLLLELPNHLLYTVLRKS